MKTNNPATGEIRPNFNHRLASNGTSDMALIDNINLMTEKATSILRLAMSSVEDNPVAYGAIYAALHEIQDVQAYLSEFQANKNPQ